ncbi:MAG TPA: PKD domain-containing protein, partial [Ignavibacteria bacterium]|nr:PKD domain-containing protein [Ignavibacteria bacterium]
MKRHVIITFFALILISSFIYAGFQIGDSNYSIKKQYMQNDSIKGWINISLENEPIDSLFKDSYGNSITLIELLKLNNNSNYDCLPKDCKKDYSTSNQQISKTFTLNKNQQKVLGFKFTGNNFEDISSFSASISSNIPTSTSKQLFIDILNNDQVEWQSYKPSNNFYNENYGCYESPSEKVLISNQDYCEKINIPSSPNVEIGAYVFEDNTTGGNAVFVLSLNGEGNSASCEITASSTGRISCVPNLKIDKKQDFFVCVRTKNSADNFKFKINSETNNSCGYAGSQENKRDFEIFAKPGKYAAVGNFILNDNEVQNSGSNTNIEYGIGNYIGRYNNNCSQGCIIPIRFISDKDNQEITFSNVSIFYTISGTPKETNEIYDLTEISAKINSKFQKLYLDNGNFIVSGKSDEKNIYSLNLNNNEIFSENISFEKAPQIISINPKTVVAAYPTEFNLKVETLNISISNYKWDFGDGTKKTTAENKVIHTYNSLGIFELKITITDSSNFSSSKIFNINVRTPKEAINSVLKNKFDN